ncbi:AAA family ATPase [Nocardiopsis alba]|uniref:AAA family ATPase n=1 Tax=Nocardiopsis alba TaxID=53437 RepID=UPI0033B39F6B
MFPRSDGSFDEELNALYPKLAKFSDPLKAPEREIVGREYEISQLMAAMSRPELCNALLLAPPGSGKTALVQAAMLADGRRVYLEVDLARMIAGLNSPDEMAALIKGLFDEAERFSHEQGTELVLFIDEFHQVVQLSPASVEALKPVLAASGARGIRVIAATTFDEFHRYVAPNQPLMERLQRINVNPPDQRTTVEILKGMARRYKVDDQFYDDHLFELIYEYTNRYIPASTQPRKSILVLDSMVGWHRYTGRPMDRALLADVLMESTNVNVAFSVDAVRIKQQLDSAVFSQNFATTVVAKRLQLCVADLNDKTKPMSSFLLTGSTGTGKTELTKQLAKLLFGDDQRHLVRFDMSEFAREESLDLFRSELTKRVWDMGHAVLLFDEIEKAASAITRVLLQVLDDGRLSDDNGRQVSFLNTYIVLTTNAGSEIYETIAQYNVDDTGSGKELVEKMKEIRRSISTTQGDNKFPPELLGRIDAIVPFQPLSRETQRKIVMNKLRGMRREVMVKHGVRVEIAERVLQYLIDDHGDTDSNAGGARAAIAKMTDEVTIPIASFINAHPYERVLRVDVRGTMRSENKGLLKSDSYVEVSAAR